MVKESIRKRQSTSCSLCRTIKRKCDGGYPCSNCSKRNHICTYPNIDHRKHRYSSEYINQLELVNRKAQDCINDLIKMKNDPQELIKRVSRLQEGQFNPSEDCKDKSKQRSESPYTNTQQQQVQQVQAQQVQAQQVQAQQVQAQQVQAQQAQAQVQAQAQQYPQLNKFSQTYIPYQQYQNTQFSNSALVTSVPVNSTPIDQQQAVTQHHHHQQPPIPFQPYQYPPTLPPTRSSSTSIPTNIHLPPIPSHPNFPPPPGVLIPGTPTGRRFIHGLDLTSKYFQGPEGRNGYFLGATSVYDESMVLTRPSNSTKLDIKQEQQQDSNNTVIGDMTINLKLLTSQKVCELMEVAFEYYNHQILCYILNIRKTRELYHELIKHVDDVNYVENILCKYPNNNYISPELVYSLSCIGSIYRDEPRDALYYYQLSQRYIFNNYMVHKSSYPKLVALILNAFYELNRGELSSAWHLSGLSFRMGFDLGFNDYSKEEPDPEINNLKNLTYWGVFIIDNFAGYIFGRPKMLLYDRDYPIFQNDLNDIKLPHAVSLLAMGDPMIVSIYQIMPFKDAEEFKRTFIVKYNQLREYNHRLIQWRNSLPKELIWNLSSLRNDARITDHSFKFAFYLIFIILNKPFLLLPIGSDISMFNIICQEMEIIFKNVEDCCYLKNIVVWYVMILVCKLMLIQILNKNSSKINDQIERLEFFINYIKRVFKPDVWILTKLPLNMLESKLNNIKKEMKQTTELSPTPLNEATASSNSSRSNYTAISGDSTIPYTDENMSQNIGFIRIVDALFSQGGTTTPVNNGIISSQAPVTTQEQMENISHINGNAIQGSNETFNNIFSFDLLDIDSYMNQ